MNADIIRNLFNGSLTEEETTPIQLDKADLLDDIIGCESSFYVKAHSDEDSFVSLPGFSTAMSQAWNCSDIKDRDVELAETAVPEILLGFELNSNDTVITRYVNQSMAQDLFNFKLAQEPKENSPPKQGKKLSISRKPNTKFGSQSKKRHHPYQDSCLDVSPSMKPSLSEQGLGSFGSKHSTVKTARQSLQSP
ncbi:hypothetical protein LIER_29592 [Lithospermum erythrorhizon]|uniref:Uncharacterized protein n=1 Tax=Lithospermum erythrorhizon TaxID=34254 RepID=A0AAV3RK60_LITER